jgi:ribosomal protein S18 acetylase RimI-like enzyme
MPAIEIRPVNEDDLPVLATIEHSVKSDSAWQIDISTGENIVAVNFREIRLPRAVSVEYPHAVSDLVSNWQNRVLFLVGVVNGRQVSYISLRDGLSAHTLWVTDLVVSLQVRRKGIASALILSAEEWARKQGYRRLVLEAQSNNLPAIRLAEKLGFEFCGYQDLYYNNRDIALFFAQLLR